MYNDEKRQKRRINEKNMSPKKGIYMTPNYEILYIYIYTYYSTIYYIREGNWTGRRQPHDHLPDRLNLAGPVLQPLVWALSEV